MTYVLTMLITSALAVEAAGVLNESFAPADSLQRWQGSAGRLQDSALVIRSDDPKSSVNRRLPIDGKDIAGRLITVRARVRASGVTKPPRSWNGIKVMLILELDGGRQYPQLDIPHGTFDWREFSRTMRVPSGVRGATLVLGLEQVAGEAAFDEVAVRLGCPVRGGKRQAERFKGHELPRLRGVMHGPRFDEENIRYLAEEWGANQVRWQLNWTPMKRAEVWARDLAAFDKWLDGALEDCDKALDACSKHGIRVLVDLHTPPGGRIEGGVCPLFTRADCQRKLLDAWRRIATRYKGHPAVYAYDLLNEPVEPKGGGDITWRELATKTISAIREIDPGKPIVFEPGPWGGPDGFDLLTPLDVERVIYSFHMYKPHRFTHQTLHGIPGGKTYPGVVEGEHWDKARLREAMRPAIEFQQEFNVHMYVGEFSAIRWAPDNSACRYLRDLTDLFEEYGWDWSYHAYREFHGWSVEHTTDRADNNRATTPTAREKLLREWFGKNARP